jgi:ribosomal protein S18 acetylase RimI-like enzyme
MSDMLVKLYDLPEMAPWTEKMRAQNIQIRLAEPPEFPLVIAWVREHFNDRWALEVEAALRTEPVTCYLATEMAPGTADAPGTAGAPQTAGANPYEQPPELMVGFAAYDVVARNLFGPTGVREDYRGRGIGTALLLACLHAMKAQRYAYAVIAWAGPTTFYAKTVGATLIEGSEPGVFRGRLAAGENKS